MIISISREKLLAQLKKNLAAAKADDALAKQRHEQDEYAALQKFRRLLSEAMKWNYADLKKHDYEVRLGRRNISDCPKAEAPEIQTAIAELEYDTRKGLYSLSPKSNLYEALMWEPRAKRPKPNMCS